MAIYGKGFRIVVVFWLIVCGLLPSPVFAETKEFILTVTDGKIELKGTEVMVWTYNEIFPGPEIRVREGDTVKVTLRNKSSAKHGLFFHGLHVNPRTSEQEQTIFVDPGYEYTYGEFVAKPAGTHLYHCSWNMAEHLSRGMFGAFIVEGRDEERFDREFVYILSDWESATTTGESSHETGHPRNIMDRDLATLNEKIVGQGDTPVMMAKEGEKIRIRIADIGYLPHRIRFPGGFLVTHEDGYPISEPKVHEVLTLHPGKRYDLVVTAQRPGRWPLFHRIERPGTSGSSLEPGGVNSHPPGGHGDNEHDPDQEGAREGKEAIALVLQITGKDPEKK